VHLLVSELYMYQNAWRNDIKKCVMWFCFNGSRLCSSAAISLYNQNVSDTVVLISLTVFCL